MHAYHILRLQQNSKNLEVTNLISNLQEQLILSYQFPTRQKWYWNACTYQQILCLENLKKMFINYDSGYFRITLSRKNFVCVSFDIHSLLRPRIPMKTV